MKTVLLILSFMLAACSTTKNADGSTQVTLHLANLTQEIQRSLLPTVSVPSAPIAAAESTETTAISTAPSTPSASFPMVCSGHKNKKSCEPSLQALFECRLPNQAAAMTRLKGVRAYGLSRKLQTPQELLKPLKLFGQPIREVTLSADLSDPGTVSWSHRSPLSINQVAKRMGIKDAPYSNGDGTMGVSIFRGNESITLTGNKIGTVVGCGYSEDTGDSY